MHQKHKGALAELHACAWLLKQGYEVFRNVSQHGIADLIAWRPGQMPIMIDVTALYIRVAADGKSCGANAVKPKHALRTDVRFLYVDAQTHTCGFDIPVLVASLGYTLRPVLQVERKICSVEGCGKKHSARGLCKNHYCQAFITPALREKRLEQRRSLALRTA